LVNRSWVCTVCLRLLPDSVATAHASSVFQRSQGSVATLSEVAKNHFHVIICTTAINTSNTIRTQTGAAAWITSHEERKRERATKKDSSARRTIGGVASRPGPAKTTPAVSGNWVADGSVLAVTSQLTVGTVTTTTATYVHTVCTGWRLA